MIPVDTAIITVKNKENSYGLVIQSDINDGLFTIAIEGLGDAHSQENLEIELSIKEVEKVRDYFALMFSLICKDIEVMNKEQEIGSPFRAKA